MKSQEAKKLEQKCQKILSELIRKDDSVVVGVSGGPDSIFLLYQLIKLQEKTNFKIIVAHLNHSIRQKQADQDQKYLKNLTNKLIEQESAQALYTSKKIDIPKITKFQKIGEEEAGRNERYKFFEELAKKHQAKFILTAHHADDNLETILMNLIRGTGLQGLSGMKKIQKISSKLFLFRPFLDFSKKQLVAWLKHHKIKYLKDPTNLSTKYRRNFLRHKIIPELQTVNPNLSETVAKTCQQIRQSNQYLQKQAKNWITRNALNKRKTQFNAKSFRKKPEILQNTILRQLHKLHHGHTQNLESSHIEEARQLINQNIGNKQKKMGKSSIYLRANIFHLTTLFTFITTSTIFLLF